MTNAVFTINEIDTYQKLRGSNPIKYGEYLISLQNEGLNQSEIADQLNTNRQMVGRYQRIGKWDDNIKNFIAQNRDKISNTSILTLAIGPKSASEILKELKSLIGHSNDNKVGTPEPDNCNEQVIDLPSSGRYKTLLEELAIQKQRLTNIEEDQRDFWSASYLKQNRQERTPQILSWGKLAHILFTPTKFFLLICIMILFTYLMHQSILFFSDVEANLLSIWSSAAVSELIPIISAGCIALSSSKCHKLISALILGITVVGLGLFMFSALSSRIPKNTDSFARIKNEQTILLDTISELKNNLAGLPDEFVTKRQHLLVDMNSKRLELSTLNKSLSAIEKNKDGLTNIQISYSVWIRIAAMLLNAFLVHIFFSGFRQNKIEGECY